MIPAIIRFIYDDNDGTLKNDSFELEVPDWFIIFAFPKDMPLDVNDVTYEWFWKEMEELAPKEAFSRLRRHRDLYVTMDIAHLDDILVADLWEWGTA